MIRRILISLFVLALFMPGSSFGEEFEGTHCYSGTFTLMNTNKELPMMFSWKQNGIIMSKS